jgi:hypothetical protein
MTIPGPIVPAKSTTAGAVPDGSTLITRVPLATPSATVTGELVANVADGFLYIKKADGTFVPASKLQVRKNSAGTVFGRHRINLIEGSNVTLTVADDSGNDEIDVTIASTGGAGDVASVFGRTGAVTATAGDYSASQISFTGSGGLAGATEVNDALNQLDTEKLNVANTVLPLGGITLNGGTSPVAWGSLSIIGFSGSATIADGDKGSIVVSGSGSTWTIDSNVVTPAMLTSWGASAGMVPQYDGAAWAAVKLGSDDVENDSGVAGTTVSDAIDTLNSGKAATGHQHIGADIVSLSGLSVFGRSTNSPGAGGDIVAGTDGDVCRRSGSTIAFGKIGSANVTAGGLNYACLPNVATRTIVGRESAGTGTLENIAASALFLSFIPASTTAAFRALAEAAGSGAATASGLTMATSRLLGRTTALAGAVEEITVGSDLSFTSATLNVDLRPDISHIFDGWASPPTVNSGVQIPFPGRAGIVKSYIITATDSAGDRVSDTCTVTMYKVSSGGSQTTMGTMTLTAASYNATNTALWSATNLSVGDTVKFKVTSTSTTATKISVGLKIAST